MSKYIEEFEGVIKSIKSQGLYPEIPIVESAATESKTMVNGEEFFLFGSNNYLGMSFHPEVREAVKKAVDKYGLGSGGPRLLSGNIDVHNELENSIASFVGRESAICFTTGFMGNIGTIPAVLKLMDTNFSKMAINIVKKKFGFKKKVKASVVSDEKNHGSIVDGIKLSGAEKFIYKHNDLADLEKKIKKASYDRKLIITDGVFSLDGDVSFLPEIVKLAKKYDSMIMVDDAHGIGTLGENGRGSLEHYGINNDDVEILLGTFTKAFGGIGGFVAGKKGLIDYLRITARTYILSAPLPPSIAAGLNKSIEIVKKEAWRREKAWENVNYFRKKVKELGYSTLNSSTLIVPVLIGDEKKAVQATQELNKRKILAPNARFPAVALGQARLRFVMTTNHQREDIDYLLNALKEIKSIINI